MVKRIFDCFTFFNEFDILELRLQTLWNVVDRFVLVEANRTFTGKQKAFEFAENAERFAPYRDKIIHVRVEDMPLGPSPWTAEFHQRNCIGRGLASAAPDDLIIVSDVDEIPKPEALRSALGTAERAITLFTLEFFHFKLNLRVTKTKLSRGAAMIEHRHFKSAQALRNVRTRKSSSMPHYIEQGMWTFDVLRTHGVWLKRVVVPRGAWHFSFMMDAEQIRQKLASYSHNDRQDRGFANDQSLGERLNSMRSFFGEPMSLVGLDELPRPIAQNAELWGHMLYRPETVG
jgi:beta-1,4-mannosyl-glycoprotein beta-1,4-N-acetylglucosaminyltransferase